MRALQQRVQESAETEEWIRSDVNEVVDGTIRFAEHRMVTPFHRVAEKLFGEVAQELIGRNLRC
jgi:PAS domain-containing protein